MPEDRIERAITMTFEIENIAPSDVRVLLTDEAGIIDLNRRFRCVDESTDVLTFPEGESASGDIAICTPYAYRQATVRGIDPADEIVFLAVHGALHLVGLDDESEVDREEMIRRMNRVAVQLGMAPDESWGSVLHEATG